MGIFIRTIMQIYKYIYILYKMFVVIIMEKENNGKIRCEFSGGK